MLIDPNNNKHLIAENGKVIARLSNLKEKYKEIWLGKYIDKNGNETSDTRQNFIEMYEEK